MTSIIIKIGGLLVFYYMYLVLSLLVFFLFPYTIEKCMTFNLFSTFKEQMMVTVALGGLLPGI